MYNDETGQVDPVKVQQQADILVRSMQNMPIQQPAKAGPSLEEFLVEAQKANPNTSVEELTEFYNKKYGG